MSCSTKSVSATAGAHGGDPGRLQHRPVPSSESAFAMLDEPDEPAMAAQLPPRGPAAQGRRRRLDADGHDSGRIRPRCGRRPRCCVRPPLGGVGHRRRAVWRNRRRADLGSPFSRKLLAALRSDALVSTWPAPGRRRAGPSQSPACSRDDPRRAGGCRLSSELSPPGAHGFDLDTLAARFQTAIRPGRENAWLLSAATDFLFPTTKGCAPTRSLGHLWMLSDLEARDCAESRRSLFEIRSLMRRLPIPEA